VNDVCDFSWMCFSWKPVSAQGSKIANGVNTFVRVFGKVGKSILGRGIEHRERPFNKIPLKRLADNRPRRLVVILSEAKNLINLNTYAFKILRLTPQNDIFGQLLNPPLEKGDFYDQVP
jgi:hypothetical protein